MSMQNVKLSDIRIFKDWLSRVGEHRNPEDIGDVHASGKIFFFSAHEIRTGLRTRFVEMYPSFHQ